MTVSHAHHMHATPLAISHFIAGKFVEAKSAPIVVGVYLARGTCLGKGLL